MLKNQTIRRNGMFEMLLLMLHELPIPQWFPFACTINVQLPNCRRLHINSRFTIYQFHFFHNISSSVFVKYNFLAIVSAKELLRFVCCEIYSFFYFHNFAFRCPNIEPSTAQNVGHFICFMYYYMVMDFVRWMDLVKITTHNQTRIVL